MTTPTDRRASLAALKRDMARTRAKMLSHRQATLTLRRTDPIQPRVLDKANDG